MQETVEVTTPLTKKKIVLRGYITGRQEQEIDAAVIDANPWEKTGEPAKVTGQAVFGAANKALEIVVISVDGATENVLDLVLDLPNEDFNFVKTEVEKIVSPLSKKKSTNSEATTTGS